MEKQSNAQGQSKWGTGGAEWVRGKKSSRAEWKQELEWVLSRAEQVLLRRVGSQQALTPVYSHPSPA